MKILVVDQQLNLGGGLRFITNLLMSIKRNRPDWQIDFFCNKIRLDEYADSNDLNDCINIVQLKSLLPKNYYLYKINTLIKKFLALAFANYNHNYLFDDVLKKEIEDISKNYDLAYFPWPFLLKSPDLKCKKVATFHDFNFKYFFGTHIFSRRNLNLLNDEIPKWLNNTSPVVSSYFMKNELLKFYPNSPDVHVIHLPSLNSFKIDINLDTDEVFNKKYSFLSQIPYIVCPVHLTPHKNLGNVISAFSILNRLSIKVRLIITGHSTEVIKGISSEISLILNSDDSFRNNDVIGLGYLSDSEMYYLIKGAFAVLNASLYEAGNGIGLDAWSLSVPVIQSNIPSFNEHLEIQGYQAFTFDPKSVNSIVGAISDCIDKTEIREKYQLESSLISLNYNWDKTYEI